MANLILFLAALSFFGCKGDDDMVIPDPVPCTSDCDTLEAGKIVWQIPLHPDTGLFSSKAPIISEGVVLFTRREVFIEDEILRAFNKENGELIWEWHEHIDDTALSPTTNSTFISEDNLVYSTTNEVYNIEFNSGSTIWGYDVPNGNSRPRINVINRDVFHVHITDDIIDTVVFLVRSDISLLSWDTVYTKYMTEGYRPGLEMPASWTHPSGDQWLIFQNRSWNFSESDGRIDLIVFNLTQGTTVYELSDIDINGTSNVRPPLIWDNKIYFMGHSTVYCFDILDGGEIWRKNFNGTGEQFSESNLILAENKLVVNPDSRTLYALDPLNGEEIWKNNDSGSSCSEMVYHAGLIYFVSHGRSMLYAVDINSGENIWAEKTPNETHLPGAAFGKTGIAIDSEFGYLYTADDYFAMCIKLPEN